MDIESSVSSLSGKANADDDATRRARRSTAEFDGMARSFERLGRKKQKRRTLTLWGFAVDLLCIAAAFVTASYVRIGSVHVDQVSRILISVLPIYMGASLNGQSLRTVVLLDGFRSAWRAGTAFAFTAASVLLIAFFMKIGAEFSRILFGLGAALALLALVGWRQVLTRIGRSYLGDSPFATLCIYDEVSRTPLSGEGSIDAAKLGLIPDPNDPKVVDHLGQIAEGMDSVVVHCPPEKRISWAFMLKSIDVPSELVAPELNDLGPLGMRSRSGQASLVISSGPMLWNQRVLKRAFDLTVTIALLPFLLPVFAIVALAVRLDSPGPVFFRQERIGLANRKFMILKFRTMRSENCDAMGTLSTQREDRRVTRVGAFLRRTSLDELPQFLNVLSGKMSVVGPRPHALGSRAENELFWDIDNRYWHRHSVKPGLTGLAQVRGFRGATEIKSDLSNRLQSDLEYIAGWSLLTDIRILAQTFAVMFHKNAF